MMTIEVQEFNILLSGTQDVFTQIVHQCYEVAHIKQPVFDFFEN